MPQRTQKLLDALQGWCDKQRGRRAKAAGLIGISPQALANWFSGRQQPTAEQILIVREFLSRRA